MDSNFNIEFISEKNNTYKFNIKPQNETISIYAPNYETALKRAKAYIKSLEPEEERWIIIYY